MDTAHFNSTYQPAVYVFILSVIRLLLIIFTINTPSDMNLKNTLNIAH